MERKKNDGMPRYQQIALDIATQIVKRQYRVGDRIYARSSLASRYHVSPETARRAVCLLAAVVRSGRRIIGFDLVEVSPAPEERIDAITGARMLWKLCGQALLSNDKNHEAA